MERRTREPLSARPSGPCCQPASAKGRRDDMPPSCGGSGVRMGPIPRLTPGATICRPPAGAPGSAGGLSSGFAELRPSRHDCHAPCQSGRDPRWLASFARPGFSLASGEGGGTPWTRGGSVASSKDSSGPDPVSCSADRGVMPILAARQARTRWHPRLAGWLHMLMDGNTVSVQLGRMPVACG